VIFRRGEGQASNKEWQNSVNGVACDATKCKMAYVRRKRERQTKGPSILVSSSNP